LITNNVFIEQEKHNTLFFTARVIW